MADKRTEISLKAVELVLLVGAALGGCEAARGVAELTDLATKPGDPKPFVTETRPQDPKYIPIGTTVSREAKRKTVDEFKKLEAELDAKRISNEAAGTQAQQLGKVLPPPAPPPAPPTE
ncbi:hypothetical protein [Bosea sp. (in: a-proteobacteria)]|uniref:hypothetical protein n=1 Tax=Bosea sp. (in: a-proteobacteria) TaxID=1871050 RepID=UPI0025C45757|nr:hypothetical protein [Bosea sp. (in: a-proteobacteria)]MBR3193702.1 hypothetical protein [Bosea sp. (in: a-proteobacteria)]